MSTWWEQGSWKGCLGWNLGTYSSCVTWESQRCQDSDGLPFKFSLLHAHPWMDAHLQGQFLRIRRRKSGFVTELLCYPGPASQSLWATVSTSEKHIRWDDLQSPPPPASPPPHPKLEHAMILLPWERIGFEWSVARAEDARRQGAFADTALASAALSGLPVWCRPFIRACVRSCPGLAWPLHQSSFCSSGFGKEPVDVETQQTGFLPKSCLDGETESREIFCFVFHKLKWLLSTEHTVTHAHTHTPTHARAHAKTQPHTQTKQDVLSAPLAGVSGNLLPSASLSPRAWIAPLW